MASKTLDLGRVAYGFWRYTEDEYAEAISLIEAAHELGITHLDTADVYGNESGIGGAERLLGRIRREAPAVLDGLSIATKGGIVFGTPYNSSADHLIAAVEASLERLKQERIELYYIHRPDVLTHPEDLARALDRLIEQGKIGAVAVSNFRPGQVDALRAYLGAPLVAYQIEFSALHASPVDNGLLDQAMQHDLAVPVWSPLAGGSLFAGDDAKAVRVRTALQEVADRMDRSLSEAALSFVMTHPARTVPILGTKNEDHLREAAAAARIRLEHADWYAIYEASLGEKLP